VSGHFRTAKARSLTFLLIPATFRPDAARRQYFDRARQNLHDACGQVAVLAIEVNAPALFATRGEAKDVAWIDVTGQLKQLRRDWLRLLDPRQSLSCRRIFQHAQHEAVFHVGLCARTHQWFPSAIFRIVHELFVDDFLDGLHDEADGGDTAGSCNCRG